MKTLNSSELSAVSGGEMSHAIAGMVAGAALVGVAYYLPKTLTVLLGGAAGAVVADGYTKELDQAFAWSKDLVSNYWPAKETA